MTTGWNDEWVREAQQQQTEIQSAAAWPYVRAQRRMLEERQQQRDNYQKYLENLETAKIEAEYREAAANKEAADVAQTEADAMNQAAVTPGNRGTEVVDILTRKKAELAQAQADAQKTLVERQGGTAPAATAERMAPTTTEGRWTATTQYPAAALLAAERTPPSSWWQPMETAREFLSEKVVKPAVAFQPVQVAAKYPFGPAQVALEGLGVLGDWWHKYQRTMAGGVMGQLPGATVANTEFQRYLQATGTKPTDEVYSAFVGELAKSTVEKLAQSGQRLDVMATNWPAGTQGLLEVLADPTTFVMAGTLAHAAMLPAGVVSKAGTVDRVMALPATALVALVRRGLSPIVAKIAAHAALKAEEAATVERVMVELFGPNGVPDVVPIVPGRPTPKPTTQLLHDDNGWYFSVTQPDGTVKRITPTELAAPAVKAEEARLNVARQYEVKLREWAAARATAEKAAEEVRLAKGAEANQKLQAWAKSTAEETRLAEEARVMKAGQEAQTVRDFVQTTEAERLAKAQQAQQTINEWYRTQGKASVEAPPPVSTPLTPEAMPRPSGEVLGVKERFVSPLGRELPTELNNAKSSASGFEVNTDGTVDFVVYGGNRNARQVKEVSSAIESAGYQSQITVPPKIVGLRHAADGTTHEMGIVRAIPRGVKPPEVPVPKAEVPVPKAEMAPGAVLGAQVKPSAVEPLVGGITQDAQNLLAQVDAGGVPTIVTNRMVSIAERNGVRLTMTTTPNEIIQQLRAKVKPPVPEVPVPKAEVPPVPNTVTYEQVGIKPPTVEPIAKPLTGQRDILTGEPVGGRMFGTAPTPKIPPGVQTGLPPTTGSGRVGGIESGPTALGVLPPLAQTGAGVPVRGQTELIRQLSEALKVPVYRGHFREKAIGIYKKEPEIIRIKRGQFRTMSHEAGHFLDDQLNLSNAIPKAEIAPLLTEYSKPKGFSKPREALAEFVRLWMTEPAKAEQRAPQFSRYFENVVAQGETGEALAKARADWKDWMSAGPVEQIKSHISFEPVTERVSVGEAFDKLYADVVNRQHAIPKFVNQARDLGITVLPGEDPAIAAKLFAGAPAKVEAFVKSGTFSPKHYRIVNGHAVPVTLGPGLQTILKPVRKDLKDFSTYLVSKHAKEVMDKGKLTGLEDVTAMGLTGGEAVEETARQLEVAHPQFADAAKKLYVYMRSLLNYARDSELIGQKAYDKIAGTYDWYVPFNRVMDELGAKGHLGQGFADVASPIKRLKGSERPIVDPIESAIRATAAIIESADRNTVGQQLVNLSKKNGLLQRVIEEIPPPTTKVATVEVPGVVPEVGNTMLDVFRPRMMNKGDQILTVRFGDETKYYQVHDHELFKGIMGLEQEQVNQYVRWASYPAKWLRAGAILSPEFWLVRNPLRDTMQAYVFSKYGFVPIVDTVRGIYSMLKKDNYYTLAERSGVLRSMMTSMDRDYLRSSLRAMTTENAAWHYAKHPLEALERLTELSELGTKMGEFRHGIQRGVPIEEVAKSAREVNIDFGVRGSQTKSLAMLTAFWNANIQAIDLTARQAMTRPGNFALKSFLGITLPSLAFYAVNRMVMGDKYDEISQQDRDLHWIIPVGDQIIAIRKPFELGLVFGSLPERVLDTFWKRDPAYIKKWAGQFLSNVLPGTYGLPIPTAVEPLLEDITNYSFYRNKNLVPAGLTDEVPELQYTSYTTEVAKKAGELTGMSPIKIENTLNGYLGGLGRHALNALDAVLKNTGVLPNIPAPSPELADYPVVRAFVLRSPIGGRSESVERFYDELDSLSKTENQLKAMVKTSNDPKFRDLKEAHPEVMLQYDWKSDSLYSSSARFLRSASKLMADLRNAQREVMRAKDMTAEQKREAVNAIDTEISTLAKAAVQQLKSETPTTTGLTGEEIRAGGAMKERSRQVIAQYEAIDDNTLAFMERQQPGLKKALDQYKAISKISTAKQMEAFRRVHPEIGRYEKLVETAKRQARETNPELETYLQEYGGLKPIELTRPAAARR